MSRNSEDRRARRRAVENDRVQQLGLRVVGPDADESELALVRVQYRATGRIIDALGLTPDGVLQVGANAATLANGIVARKSLEVIQNACSAGCAWCCVLEISAWPAEVLQLAAWLESRNAPADIELLVSRLRECVEERDVENAAGRVPKVVCPLLAADRTCSVYDARPAACAAGMASDVGPCKAYAEGADDDAGGFISAPAVGVPAHVSAEVIAERGGPSLVGTGAAIDLHTGLATALREGAIATTSLWMAGADVFREARDRLMRRREILAALGPREERFLHRSRS